MATFGTGPIGSEEIKQRGYQGQPEGGLKQSPDVFQRPENQGRMDSKQGGDFSSQSVNAAKDVTPEGLKKAREALKVAEATQARSDTKSRSLTADQNGAILSGDGGVLKELGLPELTTNNGVTARALTDMLNRMEEGK